MYRSSPFRSTLNTGYITCLGMCKVCTEAVHSVALCPAKKAQTPKHGPGKKHRNRARGVFQCRRTSRSAGIYMYIIFEYTYNMQINVWTKKLKNEILTDCCFFCDHSWWCQRFGWLQMFCDWSHWSFRMNWGSSDRRPKKSWPCPSTSLTSAFEVLPLTSCRFCLPFRENLCWTPALFRTEVGRDEESGAPQTVNCCFGIHVEHSEL